LDGQEATVAHSTCNCLIEYGSAGFQVEYAGLAPGMVDGVTQINFLTNSEPGFLGGARFSLVVPTGQASAATLVYLSQ
jgi:uncharacterized protein (TIGR03437 family)